MKKEINKIISNIVVWILRKRVKIYKSQLYVSDLELSEIHDIDNLMPRKINELARDLGERLYKEGYITFERRREKFTDLGYEFRLRINVVK